MGKFEKWRRFERTCDSYWYLSTTSTDAIKFIPKKDVYWLGFGMYGNYNKKDMPMKFWYFIDDEQESEKYEVTVIESELEQPEKTFDVFLKDYGIKPIKISAGQKLTILQIAVSTERELCRQWYGADGHNYQNLPN